MPVGCDREVLLCCEWRTLDIVILSVKNVGSKKGIARVSFEDFQEYVGSGIRLDNFK